MRHGKPYALRSPELWTLFLVTTIVFAVLAIGLIVGRLWTS
jgi:hypothetical protein